jgi:hypothetical protein
LNDKYHDTLYTGISGVPGWIKRRRSKKGANGRSASTGALDDSRGDMAAEKRKSYVDDSRNDDDAGRRRDRERNVVRDDGVSFLLLFVFRAQSIRPV